MDLPSGSYNNSTYRATALLAINFITIENRLQLLCRSLDLVPTLKSKNGRFSKWVFQIEGLITFSKFG
ncbi:hypothetical protein DZB84_14310 [Bacillus sp. HNG]|nr:hypothetical protein DZB84_14310 [Bacillus sp. HNG]